jgi:hypothetical protein
MFFARKFSRHARFTAGSVIAFALLAGACSSESSVDRVKNAALDVQAPITCTLGGSSPSGGIVVSLSADKNADSIESAPVRWNGDPATTRGLLSSFDPFKKWSEVAPLVSAYRGGGKSDWIVPSRAQWSLIKTQVFSTFGANDYFTSDVIQAGYQWGINSAGNESLIQSGPNERAHVRPIRFFKEATSPCVPATTTTVAATTTTTIVPQACSAGGLCSVGDTGIGGGVVFSAVVDAAGNTTVLEAAPANWTIASTQPETVGTRTVFPPQAGEGKATAIAAAYRGGDKSDWRLPTVNEMTALCKLPGKLLGSSPFWADNGGGQLAVFNAPDCAVDSYRPSFPVYFVRPVRNFTISDAVRKSAVQYYEVNPTTTSSTVAAPTTTTSTSTTTTSTTTTTTTTPTTTTTTTAKPTTTPTTTIKLPDPCTNASRCLIGQRGEGGGVIVSAIVDGATTKYVEMALSGWAGTATDPKVNWTTANAQARAFRGGDMSDWRLPTLTPELEAMCRYGQGKSSYSYSDVCTPTGIPTIGGFGQGGDYMAYWGSANGGEADIQVMNTGSRRRVALSDTYFVRPVRVYSYVPATTTSTLPKTCRGGGVCKTGDVSPTGGLIIDFEKRNGENTYIEIAPRNWAADGPTVVSEKRFTRSAADRAVNDYAGLGNSNWRVPSIEEMRAAYYVVSQPTLNSTCESTSFRPDPNFRLGPITGSYWVVQPDRPTRFVNFNAGSGAVYYDVNFYTSPWRVENGASTREFDVRPVRSMRYTGSTALPDGPNWAPAKCKNTAIATTTTSTIPASCQTGGLCRLGDIGMYGGVIIGIDTSVADGPMYTEMSTDSRGDCVGTSNIMSSCTMGPWSASIILPTIKDLQNIRSLPATIRNRLNLRAGGSYWTNRQGVYQSFGADVSGSLNEMMRSLQVERVEAHYVVNIATGVAQVSTSGYLRGVQRYNCHKACFTPR